MLEIGAVVWSVQDIRRGVSPSTALRLAKFFGTSAGFWLNLQVRWDLYHVQQAEADVIESIEPRQLSGTT